MMTSQPAGEPAAVRPELSLEDFAKIQAADQDDIPREEALAAIGVTEEAYAAAWPDKIEEMASGRKASTAYQSALEDAQDALHRPITPLFDDVVAWMAYNLALSEGPARPLMEETGLTAGDLARLERHWRPKLETDQELAKAAREARMAGIPDPLPPIEIGERKRDEPLEQGEGDGRADAQEPSSEDLFDAIELAAVFQAMLDEGADEETLVARGAESTVQARTHVEGTLARAESSTDLMTYFRGRVEHVRRLLKARAAGAVPARAQPMVLTPPHHAPLDVTGPVDGLRFDETGFLDPMTFQPDEALPFDGEGSSAPMPVADILDPNVDKGATSTLDPAQFQDMALPFGGDDEPVLDETSAFDPAQFQHLELPFQNSDATEAPAPIADSLDPAESLGETSAIDPSQFQHLALPFQNDPPVEPEATHHVTDVRRYASFLVDLEVYAGHEHAVRTRYAIEDERSQRELVTRWEEKLEAEPALRAELEQAAHTYRQWLQSQRPP